MTHGEHRGRGGCILSPLGLVLLAGCGTTAREITAHPSEAGVPADAKVKEDAALFPYGHDADRADVSVDTGEVDVLTHEAGGDEGIPDAAIEAATFGRIGQQCQQVGALSCNGRAQKGRIICGDDLRWKENGSCEGNRLCDAQTPGTEGSCQDVIAACVGLKPGEFVCDGAVRTVCGPDLVTKQTTICPTAKLCQLGTAATCGQCEEGQYTCEGAALKKCNATHAGYDLVEQCASASLCKAGSGACSSTLCVPNEYRCTGDALEKCNAAQDNFVAAQSCSAGLCDALGKQCDSCVPGVTSCADGHTRQACGPDGQAQLKTECISSAPFCVGTGQCVQCTADSQCPATECTSPVCNSAQCGASPRRSGTACSGGVCDGVGNCVQCVTAAQCPAGNACAIAACRGSVCSFDNVAVNVGVGTGTACQKQICDGAGHVQDVDTAGLSCGDHSACKNKVCQACFVPWDPPGLTAAYNYFDNSHFVAISVDKYWLYDFGSQSWVKSGYLSSVWAGAPAVTGGRGATTPDKNVTAAYNWINKQGDWTLTVISVDSYWNFQWSNQSWIAHGLLKDAWPGVVPLQGDTQQYPWDGAGVTAAWVVADNSQFWVGSKDKYWWSYSAYPPNWQGAGYFKNRFPTTLQVNGVGPDDNVTAVLSTSGDDSSWTFSGARYWKFSYAAGDFTGEQGLIQDRAFWQGAKSVMICP